MTAELKSLVAAHPLDESLAALLMQALRTPAVRSVPATPGPRSPWWRGWAGTGG
jgi:hypothetical protein